MAVLDIFLLFKYSLAKQHHSRNILVYITKNLGNAGVNHLKGHILGKQDAAVGRLASNDVSNDVRKLII